MGRVWDVLCHAIPYGIAALAEVQTLRLLLQTGAIAEAALWHAAALSILLIWTLTREMRIRSRDSALVLVSTVALGPLGFLGASFAVLICRLGAPKFRDALRTYQEWLTGTVQSQASEHIYVDLVSGRERPGQSLVNNSIIDVLRWGTLEEKHKAISSLAKAFRPELAPALRFALTSSEPTIRIQAASLMAKLERDFMQRWVALRQSLSGPSSSSDDYIVLARHLDSYAYAGILDDVRQVQIRGEARKLFEAYLAHHPSNQDGRIALGRLLTRLGHYGDALTCLAPVLNDERALSWYCQALYGLRRFEDLRRMLGTPQDRQFDPLPFEDVARLQGLWSSPTRAAPLLSGPQGSSS